MGGRPLQRLGGQRAAMGGIGPDALDAASQIGHVAR
jgi:hypothetical protein